jgi:hypothetical protein
MRISPLKSKEDKSLVAVIFAPIRSIVLFFSDVQEDDLPAPIENHNRPLLRLSIIHR